MSSTTIFDFNIGIVCTFESSQIAASGVAGCTYVARVGSRVCDRAKVLKSDR